MIKQVDLPATEYSKGRVAYAEVTLKGGMKLLMVTVYGFVGIGFEKENLKLLQEI